MEWQHVRDAVTARRVLAYLLMPLLLICAFASLIALNLLLRDLWGELAYAILVTGVALWALSQAQFVARRFERLGVRQFTIRRAILLAGAYCDTSKAPGSPAGQPRYRDPGRPGPWLCVSDGRAADLPELEHCGDEVDPDTEISA